MRTVYSDQTKASALAAVATGRAVNAVAREMHIPTATLRSWLSASGRATPILTPEKKLDLGELIGQYLLAGLQALEAQARAASDPEWIKKQPADQLAILHGVLADKLTRILAALEPIEPEPEPDAY